jgi:galactokinase
VRQPAAHAVHENFRVQAFRQILAAAQPGGSGGPQQAQQLEALGELMLQSHVSYGACGLGSAGTDRLVALVLEERAAAGAAGAAPALYGAKITGGGCGGGWGRLLRLLRLQCLSRRAQGLHRRRRRMPPLGLPAHRRRRCAPPEAPLNEMA